MSKEFIMYADIRTKGEKMITIPEKYREEFDKAASFAVIKGNFTPAELAEYLETSVLVASIMIGYMEKAGLITKGKNEDVRNARISLNEWERIGKRIENYEPLPEPEPEPEPFVTSGDEKTVLNLSDVVTGELSFIKKTLSSEGGFIIITSANGKTAIALEDIDTVFMNRGSFFKKSSVTFSTDGKMPKKTTGRADTLVFKKAQYQEVRNLAEKICDRLGINLKEY